MVGECNSLARVMFEEGTLRDRGRRLHEQAKKTGEPLKQADGRDREGGDVT